MKLHIKNLILIIMMALVTIGGTISCSSKKKLAKKEYEAKVEQSKKDLNAIINEQTQWTLEEQLSRVNEIEQYNLQNSEVDELIVKAKDKLAKAKAEKDRVAEEERLRAIEAEKANAMKPVTSLQDYFAIIAAAPDAETANDKIAEALEMFSSSDVPVLIIIYQLGDVVDYDAPTTIDKYLNYIKDQKVVNVDVNNIKYDNNHKITELELIKK